MARTTKPKTYVRDGRAPIPAKESTSKLMSANRGTGTKPELRLRRELWRAGVRGYRVNYRAIAGKPDLAFVGKRIAVFVHGCFWHRCPTCNPHVPKSNEDFWSAKFSRNVERDRRNEATLVASGWIVRTVWECELKRDLTAIVAEIQRITTSANLH